MNIRVIVGYVSFAMSVLISAYQLISLPDSSLLPPHRLLVLCLVSLILIAASLLALESKHRASLHTIAVVAFLLCGAALLCLALYAIIGPTRMEPFKYALILFYGLLYGAFGLIVSLLVHRRFDRAKV